MIGRTHSKLNERLAAAESEGFEPSFEDDPLLARQSEHESNQMLKAAFILKLPFNELVLVWMLKFSMDVCSRI